MSRHKGSRSRRGGRSSVSTRHQKWPRVGRKHPWKEMELWPLKNQPVPPAD